MNTNAIRSFLGLYLGSRRDRNSNFPEWEVEIWAMKPDFNVMTKSELRAYVLKYREDTAAFEALADRIYANPNPQWYQPEDTEKIVDLIQASKQSNLND